MDVPSSSLCPGYKQVDAFGPDECYEDEEVCYVTLDLGDIEPTLLPSTSTYRLIGLDTPTPFMQLSGTILKGQHRSLLGTELLFTEQKDDNDRTKKYMTPVGTSEQQIRFSEVRLKPATPQPVPSKDKGKAKEKGTVDTDALQDVDRITGVTGRVGRSREGKSKGKKRRKIEVGQDPEGGGDDRVGLDQLEGLTVMDIAED